MNERHTHEVDDDDELTELMVGRREREQEERE
jgi:hypothetical protein